MSNEAKSIEIATNVADGYGVDFEPLAEAALDMAEWKDQQFKEYLKKKYDEQKTLYEEENEDNDLVTMYYERMTLLDEIINELFNNE